MENLSINKTLKFKSGENYLLIMKTPSIDNVGNYKSLSQMMGKIERKFKCKVLLLIISESDEFALVPLDDMSIEQAITNMGLVKKEIE